MTATLSSSSSPILETERLILRPVRESDIPVLHRLVFGDADVMRYLFRGVPMNRSDSEAVIRAHFTFDSSTGYAVLTEKPGNVIGYAGLAPCNVLGEDDLELGFVMGRYFWGRGYATEIGQGQLAYGFETLGRQRVLGLVDRGNAPSIAALTKIGMTYVSDVTPPDRAPRRVFAVSIADWKSRKCRP